MEEKTSGFKAVKKKKGRFNLVDLFLILIALAVVFVMIFVIDPFSIELFDNTEKEVKLEYTIRIENVENTLINKIAIGNEVVDSSTKTSLGFVSSVENDIPHTEPYYDSEIGVVSMMQYENRYDLVVTVTSANATFTEGVGYEVNDRRVAVGTQLYLMFPDFVGTGSCISIREIG